MYPYFLTPRTIIFGGDFNCVQNTAIDKIGGNPNKGTLGWNELAVLVRDNNLVDVYRNKNPNKIAVSWSDGPNTGFLLDRIFIPSQLAKYVENVSFVPCTFSDHDLLKVKLSPLPADIDAGKGYWKFNNSLLDDINFKGKIRARILSALEDITENTNLTEWWDNLKISFKVLAIKHSTFLSKENNKMRAALTAQYILAEKMGKLENMTRVKNKLKELDIKKSADQKFNQEWNF